MKITIKEIQNNFIIEEKSKEKINDFNEIIDKNIENIEILGVEMAASEILRKCRPEEYLKMFIEYIEMLEILEEMEDL